MIILIIVLFFLLICSIFIIYKKLPLYKGAGIAVFIHNGDDFELLLGKRKYNPDKNKWSIPGGGLEESDESFLDGAKREFQEELNYNFDNIKTTLVTTVSINIPKYKWKTFCYLTDNTFFYDANKIHEFSELKYIPLNELKNYHLATFVKKEVRAFLKVMNKY